MISDDAMHKALDRIARTVDGELLYRWLQKKLMGVSGPLEGGALPFAEGQRYLASELMGLMTQGMQESNGRADAAIIFAVAEQRVRRDHPGGRRGGGGGNAGDSEYDDAGRAK